MIVTECLTLKYNLSPSVCLHVRLYLPTPLWLCDSAAWGASMQHLWLSVWVMGQGKSLWLLNGAQRIIEASWEAAPRQRGALWALLGRACWLGPLPELMWAVSEVAWGAASWGLLQRYAGTAAVCFWSKRGWERWQSNTIISRPIRGTV